MKKKISFKLIALHNKIADGEFDMVALPGLEGEFAVLYNHVLSVIALKAGVASLYQDGKVVAEYVISSGLAHVNNEKCVVLVDHGAPLNNATSINIALDEQYPDVQSNFITQKFAALTDEYNKVVESLNKK